MPNAGVGTFFADGQARLAANRFRCTRFRGDAKIDTPVRAREVMPALAEAALPERQLTGSAVSAHTGRWKGVAASGSPAARREFSVRIETAGKFGFVLPNLQL